MRIKHKNILLNKYAKIDFVASQKAMQQLSIQSMEQAGLKEVWNDFENLHFYTHGNFNIMDLLIYAVNDLKPCKLWISSFSLSKHACDQLNVLYKSESVTELNVMLDYRVKISNPDLIYQLESFVDSITLTKNHSKLILIGSHNEKQTITVTSSANLNTNPRNEAGVISKDIESFDFYKNIFEREIEQYGRLIY